MDSDHIYLLQQLLNGVTLGAVYGLIALGYAMVYGILGMINFAHGEIYMIGAYLAYLAFSIIIAVGVGLPLVASILIVIGIAVFFTGFYGWSVERLAYRPLRNSNRLAPLISAIGMSVVLQNYVRLAQGARIKSLPPQLSGNQTLLETETFNLTISNVQLLIICTTVILLTGFTYLIVKTPFGRAQRATEQDPKMASLIGINVDKTISLTFVLGAVMAAVAGVMVTLQYGVNDFNMGFLAGIKAFAAAVLGGITSLPGAAIGGILIGVIETLWSAYIGEAFKNAAAFVVLILVLLVKPTGLFGRPTVEKI